MGPTIQQGVIQCPVQRNTQPTATGAWPKNTAPPVNIQQTVRRLPSPNYNNGSVTSDPGENGRDRLPEREENPNHNSYILNCRPVFVNHYYAGELLIPVTNKKLIRLEECDVLTENLVGNQQLQGVS